jgi:hypothetical protein
MQILRTERFRKDFRRLPVDAQKRLGSAMEQFVANPRHPALRVKKMEGAPHIWELGVSDNCQVTFEYCEGGVILRRVGPHDILRRP